GGSIRLKIINSDFSRSMHIPTWFGEKGGHVTRRAFSFAFENYFPIGHFGRRIRSIGHATWSGRRGYGQLIKMERPELGSDQIRIASNIAESHSRGYRELRRVIQSRIVECTLAMHFQICYEGIPMCHRTPTSPCVEVHACQAKSGWYQGSSGLSVIAKSLSVEKDFGIELTGAPTGEDLPNCCRTHAQ